MEVSGQLHVSANQGKRFRYPFGPHGRSGRGGEEKKSCPWRESNHGCQPLLSRHTDWATPVPQYDSYENDWQQKFTILSTSNGVQNWDEVYWKVTSLQQLKGRLLEATATVTQDMIGRPWQQLMYTEQQYTQR
jgi:hypothetical protein